MNDSSAGVDSGSLRDSALGEAAIRLTISTGGGSARRNSSQSSADFSRAYASGVATPNPSRREVWIVMELLDQLNLHKLVKSEPGACVGWRVQAGTSVDPQPWLPAANRAIRLAARRAERGVTALRSMLLPAGE